MENQRRATELMIYLVECVKIGENGVQFHLYRIGVVVSGNVRKVFALQELRTFHLSFSICSHYT